MIECELFANIFGDEVTNSIGKEITIKYLSATYNYFVNYLLKRVIKIKMMDKRERIEYVKKAIKEYRAKFNVDDYIMMNISDTNLADCL